MQQTGSPAVLVTGIVVALVLLGALAFWVLGSRTTVAAPAAARGAPTNPTTGGGPTAADLQRMREYNARNPGAPSSRR